MEATDPGADKAQVPQALQMLDECRALEGSDAAAAGRVIGRRVVGLGWVSARAWATRRTP